MTAPQPLDPAVDYSRPGSRQRAPVRYWSAPAGYCRWCGRATATLRLRWHGQCVDEYKAHFPASQRQRVWAAALGECQTCGRFCPRRETIRPIDLLAFRRLNLPTSLAFYRAWESDHLVPLADGGANDDQNLQLLCQPCHRDKTAAEATARAAQRRGAA